MPFIKKEHAPSDKKVLKAKLNLETSVVEWAEITPHFARGVVIVVEQELSLVDVATSMGMDDKEAIAGWLEKGSISNASDNVARDWHKRQPLLWCVVVAPWVLVQEKPGTSVGEVIH